MPIYSAASVPSDIMLPTSEIKPIGNAIITTWILVQLVWAPDVGHYSDYTIATKLRARQDIDKVEADYAQGQLHSSSAPADSV